MDARIDFEPIELAFTLDSGRLFPTEYFSIKWEGFLKATHTETFKFFVDAYKTS